MRPKIERFVAHITCDVISKGGSIHFLNQKCIEDCRGIFEPDDRKISVAVRHPQKKWISVLAHEYSHFMQMRDPYSPWHNPECDLFNIWEWRDGEDQDPSDLKKVIRATQHLESDCDQRALKLLNNFDMGIDNKWFIAHSNAYVWFYEIMRRERVWYKKSMHLPRDMEDMMPETFIQPDDYGKVPLVYEHFVKNNLI